MHTKRNGCFLPFFFVLLISVSFLSSAMGQVVPKKLILKNGVFSAERNISEGRFVRDSLHSVHYKKKYYTLIQFGELPDTTEKKELSEIGIHLFDYMAGNAFLAEIPEDFSPADLKRHHVNGVYALPSQLKISRELLKNPEEYAHSSDQLITVSFFGTIDQATVTREIEQLGGRVIPKKLQSPNILFINAGGASLQKIAALPYISHLGVQSVKVRELNYNNRAAHGADVLGSAVGRNLQGTGVTIGMGDNSDPYTHVDFTGRLIDRFAAPVMSHGTHTTGIAGGGGIIDPRYKGMAPQATIISQYFTDILSNAPTYIADNNMVLTNNSYTEYNNGCAFEGEYDAYAYFTDAQLLAYPSLLHVFASGNDGALTCTPYPIQYATVKSGFQCAKNVLTVGNLNNTNPGISSIFIGSSSGPVNDGRIKPEVVTGGTSIISTLPNNGYGTMTGTSMAAPTATGTLALLYQRYRQLHAGADPLAALIKAVACNGANDLGNPGPDFLYGFGMLNARAAVEAIEGNHYFTGNLTNHGLSNFTISGVPAGTQQIKILLYWPDQPASLSAVSTLVNNLDLTVAAPDGTLHHPLILNPAAGHTSDPAVEGVDSTNNIEQVVINNPPAGNFSVSVSGASIPGGSQNYVVAYQIIQPSVIVEYPYGGETWVPGLTETIRWSAYGADPNAFTLEYSADNGASWTTISSIIPGSNRSYAWTTPGTPTTQGLIRITRNGTTYSAISSYNFSILGQPAVSVTNPCQGYAQLSWSSIPSATSYDIMELRGDTMQVIANTASTSYLLGGLSRDSSYWLAVRALNNSEPGRRSLASPITPSGGSCALGALDNDLSADSLAAPVTGRMYTSSQLSAATTIRIGIKNLGTIATSGVYTLSYRVNGGTIVTESSAAAIAPNTELFYNFTNTADLSAPGSYNLQIWVKNPGDPSAFNDTLTTQVVQLKNDPLALNPAYTEGFESATDQTYSSPIMGFSGLDRCDFKASNANGRARTFINSGFARTGNRCATLDERHYSLASSADSLITTFNLSSYSGSDQLWLDFFYNNRGIDFNMAGNKAWIRGNENAAWIPVYDLDTNAANIGNYQPSSHINITESLAKAIPAQQVGSSFQIKFGEEGYTSANSVIPDGDLDDGYSFDDITITRSVNDIGMMALIPPDLTNLCSLSNAETISVKVRNYSIMTANSVPVSYSVNGVVVTETIPSINPSDSVLYTFIHKADLSAYQQYTLSAWVSNISDNYRGNDTAASILFQTAPLISTYPYLEGFESNNGYWYTGGVNSSWQWGAPAKTVIDKAANGDKCWVTSLTGNYNNNELSYLYSPCFDLSSLHNPVFSFSHIFQTEDDCDCDYHWAEYSTDGVVWTKLGQVNWGTNWYDNAVRKAWQLSNPKWHVSSYDIPTNSPKVRFRIVMNSDPGTAFEGVGVDDIHIFDKTPIYTGPDVSSGLAQTVSGKNWINFDQGGGRVVSINPNGQDLGNTNVAVYINTNGVRNDGHQYYLDRNIVIQPANPPAGNVSVRYYFLDKEADSLINASGCTGCQTITDAYQAGVMQYSSPMTAEEDSLLSNDSSGTFHYLLPHQDLTIIPYDKGYYAEYQVTGFSEFWINNGTPGTDQLYPLALLSFTAARAGSGALLQWSTEEEMRTSRFVIQKSADGNQFSALDSLKAVGDSNTVNHYRYMDNNLINGTNYYRLKLIAADGSYKYSPVRKVNDTINTLVIHLYPNPVLTGTLYISTSVNCQLIQLLDVSGRALQTVVTHGYMNSLYLGNVARGVYIVKVWTDGGEATRKIFVNSH